jgi:hypothetical protein
MLEFFKECKFSYIGATEILNNIVNDDFIVMKKQHNNYNKKLNIVKNDIIKLKEHINKLIQFYKSYNKLTDERIQSYMKKIVFKQISTLIDEYKTLKNKNNTIIIKPILQTEDTGKIFEKAICLLYEIEYEGHYKYNIDDAIKLKEKLELLKQLFPMCKHTSKNQGRYDFTSLDNKSYLSAKTTKSVGKIAPAVVGQTKPEKFCELLNIEYKSIDELKKYIQENIVKILAEMYEYTLDCSIIYYNRDNEKIKYIEHKNSIEWSDYEYSWTKKWNEWNNSSTLKIKKDGHEYTLMEFQFHSTNRTNMAIRWYFENLLNLFKDNLSIITF